MLPVGITQSYQASSQSGTAINFDKNYPYYDHLIDFDKPETGRAELFADPSRDRKIDNFDNSDFSIGIGLGVKFSNNSGYCRPYALLCSGLANVFQLCHFLSYGFAALEKETCHLGYCQE